MSSLLHVSALFPKGKNPRFSWIRRLGVLSAGFDVVTKKTMKLPVIEPRSSHSIVTTLTELSRLYVVIILSIMKIYPTVTKLITNC